LCTRRRKNGRWVQGFPTVDQLLRDMDIAGVSKAVLLGWYWENHATCVEQNNFYAECIRRHPDRLVAFATVHPSAGQIALDEVCRARDAGLIGLGELSPHSQGVPWHDPWWLRLMALAAELRFPVNLHVTDPNSALYPGRVETPLADFIGLAREFPTIRFILAHWGGGLAFDSECRPLRNVYYDTAASPLLYSPEVWSRGLAAAGRERILFGSDYPLVLYPRTDRGHDFTGLLEEVETAGLNDPQKNCLLHENARRLLGL